VVDERDFCTRAGCGYGVPRDFPICTKCGTPNLRYISPLERRMAAVKMALLQEDYAGALDILKDVDPMWLVDDCKKIPA
jgi:hypothetical protein